MRTLLLTLTLALLALPMLAQTAPDLSYRYDIAWPDPHTRRYLVTLTVSPQAGEATEFKMPAWRPGRYILQNFAAGVTAFEAEDSKGNALSWRKTDKDTWRVNNPSRGPITVRYRFYANTPNQAGFVLTPDMAYLNPFFLLYLADRMDAPATVRFSSKAADWRIATQLYPTADAQVFTAPSYHYLLDSPTMISPTLRTFRFEALGRPIYAHFQGKWNVPDGDERPWLDGVRKMIEQQAAVFGEFPCKEYHLIYLLLPGNYASATEHENSAMFAMPEAVSADARSLGGLNGITSHELWHLWNVKRVRPAAMWPYRYDREVPTSLHWLTEGVTSYYTDLTLVRAGLLSREQYLSNLSGLLAGMDNGTAQQNISPSQSSTDSWLDGSNYQDPESGISFYSQGARIGLLLDLEIRRRTKHRKGLDDVMRLLYTEAYKQNKGVDEDGVQRAAEAVTGDKLGAWFDTYVHGRGPYAYDEIFDPLGIQLASADRAGTGLRRIGLPNAQAVAEGGVLVRRVMPQSEAERAGFMTGDLITQVNDTPIGQINVPTFFDSLAVPTRLVFKGMRSGTPLELRVNYRNGSSVKVYTISLDPKKSEWATGWLGARTDVPKP